MKLIQSMMLSLLLLTGLWAKDADFGHSLEPTQLKVGSNEITVVTDKKGRVLLGTSAKLSIYKDGVRLATYKSAKPNMQAEHKFNVNFKESGEYRYVLSFNLRGGVTHTRKGDLSVEG